MESVAQEKQSVLASIVKVLPGFALFTSVALVAWYVTPLINSLHPVIKSLNLSNFIVAIILGMVILNVFGVPEIFQPGLKFSTILTKTGIVVMGCKYSFEGLLKTGTEALIIIAVFLFATALILMWIGQKLHMSPALSACLAAGLSVCGVSAAVAIAPAVRAKNEDMAYTIAVVLMFGLIALFVFPFVGQWFELTGNQFGAFAGVGIINSAQVLAAGLAFSPEAGDVAGVYNIGRVVFLPFVVLTLAIMVANADADVQAQMEGTSKMKLIIDKFPVFVIGFIAIVTFNTFGFLTQPQVKMASSFMNWCFLLGFSSIGLTTRLSDIKAAGLSGAALGFVVAGLKAALALWVVIYFLK